MVFVGFVAFTGAPYVPSKRREVVRALSELYPLTKNDLLVDIGSGDGVVLREASARGARAVGYEIQPLLWFISVAASRKDKNVAVKFTSFWGADLPEETTVVYTFGDARDILKMYKKVQSEATRLGKPLAFISYAFEVPNVKAQKAHGAHYLYLVKPLQ